MVYVRVEWLNPCLKTNPDDVEEGKLKTMKRLKYSYAFIFINSAPLA